MKRVFRLLACFAGLAALRAVAPAGAGEASSAAVTDAAAAAAPAPESAAASAPLPLEPGERALFYVIPVRQEIGEPTLYIVRKGVKEAIEEGADCVILDMNTPGGEGAAMLEIMEILEKFERRTVAYVNRQALSAGALISAATDQIYFAPHSVLGAAAPVTSTGQDIDETMREKVVSFLRAKVRAISEGHRYRGEVISAMIDSGYELEIEGEVIKRKGELLTLTAEEAVQKYGEPPQPLLGAGIEEDLPALYAHLAGGRPFDVRQFEMTWSIELAQWLNRLSPLLLSAGLLLLFIEFKTPGFGFFGIGGIALLLLVFFGHHVAGLSGSEPVLFFLLGVALVLVELLFFPGVVAFALAGVALIIGSLLWGMADIWPGNAFELNPGMFVGPALNLSLGVLLAVVFAVLLARFLPKSTFWSRMVLGARITGRATQPTPVIVSADGVNGLPVSGDVGVVVSDLRPTGVVDIRGRRFEARVEVGELRAGARVSVVRRADFVLVVEPEAR